MNGYSTQIDFVATRRPLAHAAAKRAKLLDVDLVPWRNNAKHRMVVASVPLIAGWRVNTLRAVSKPRRKYDSEALDAAAQTNAPEFQALCSSAEDYLRQADQDVPFGEVNKRVLRLCEQAYPLKPKPREPRPWMTQGVIASLAQMWDLHRALRNFGRGRNPSVGACWMAWRCAVAFDRQVRDFRRAGRQRRKQDLLDKLVQAQRAASSFSQGKLYRIIRQVAPQGLR